MVMSITAVNRVGIITVPMIDVTLEHLIIADAGAALVIEDIIDLVARLVVCCMISVRCRVQCFF